MGITEIRQICIGKIVDKYIDKLPNDMDLGVKIRAEVHNLDEKFESEKDLLDNDLEGFIRSVTR